MTKVTRKGRTFRVGVEGDAIAAVRDNQSPRDRRRLAGLRRFSATFDERGDLLGLVCNGRGGCERFSGPALGALLHAAKCHGAAKLGLSMNLCGASSMEDVRRLGDGD